jgi:hypothetical protein
MTQSLIPREAAQLALSLELIAVRRTGGKITQQALARVRKATVEVSGCSKAFAAKTVEELTAGIAKHHFEPAKEPTKLPRKRSKKGRKK